MGGLVGLRRALLLLGGAVTLLAFAGAAAAKDEKPSPPRRDATTLLVRFADPATADTKIRMAGDTPSGRVGRNVSVVKIKAGTSLDARLSVYRSRSDVVYAEPNYIAGIELAAPNDTSYASQWGMTAIGAVDGWSIYPGSYTSAGGPPIAVLDTGIDASHPDLSSHVQTAQGANCLGVAGACSSGNSGDNQGHGTHVAGIAAALTNNAAGVAGVAISSPLIPVKVLDSDGFGEYGGIANGILWAASHGARVINLSLGGTGYSQTLCDAVTSATSSGSVVVAAAGNSGVSFPSYPAACPGAVGVAATDSTGGSPDWSNWDRPNVFLSAPGDAIFSTMWSGTSISAACTGQSYCSLRGTSMASPHVAGLAALLFGQVPSRTPADVKVVLATTAERIGAERYPPLTYGTDPIPTCSGCTWHPYYGYGEIDVQAALAHAGPRILTISRSGTGTGVVASAPAGIDCGSTCSQAFPAGASVTLTATPADGSHRAGWIGCDAVTAGACTVQMSSAKSVTAIFTLGTFADVPASHQFFTYIEEMFARGITTGCGANALGARLYCPNDQVSRQAMAAFIIRALGVGVLTPAVPSFADVPTGHQFYGHIERMLEQGITTGCGRNAETQLVYCPNDPVTRQALAAFLIRAKGLGLLTPAMPSFADVPAGHPFYGHIERMLEQGITTGCGRNAQDQLLFCPTENVTRQAMAAFIIRTFPS